jgi:hypothetical protein
LRYELQVSKKEQDPVPVDSNRLECTPPPTPFSLAKAHQAALGCSKFSVKFHQFPKAQSIFTQFALKANNITQTVLLICLSGSPTSSRLSPLSIVNDLLRKVGALENKLTSYPRKDEGSLKKCGKMSDSKNLQNK